MNLLTISNSKDSDINLSQSTFFNNHQDIITKSVESFEDLENAIKGKEWHAVFCHCQTPGFSSVENLIRLKKITKNLPIFLLSETHNIQNDVQILEVSRDDVVMDANPDKLNNILENLLYKKSNPSFSTILSIAYHDIKNPISAIQLDAQMLEILSQKEFYPEMLSDIKLQSQRIFRTINRIKKLISNLLELHGTSRTTDDQQSFVIHKQFNNPILVINDILETYDPLLFDKKIELIKLIPSYPIRGFFDKDRISQVISNLLSNAIKFSPKGSKIIIGLNTNEKRELVFSIEDSGPGIPRELSHLVFDKYWTNGTGNGLGLYICKEIIDGHGGTIKIESENNHGTRFTFVIPAFDLNCENCQNNFEDINLNVDNLILIIDDDEDLRDVISWALKKEQYEVASFANPFAAIRALSQIEKAPKLIILDFNLVEMNGEDFLKVKADSANMFFQKCPVLLITAASEEIIHTVDSNLYDVVLQKPLDLKGLLDTVNLKTHDFNLGS